MKIKSILAILILLISLSKILFAANISNYDYLIIVHENFIDASQTWDDQLIALQQTRGFTPYIYQVDDQMTATDIKNQIAYCYNNGVQLKYVLLIGNASTITTTGQGTPTNIYVFDGAISEAVSSTDNNFIPFWSISSANIWGTNGTSLVASDQPYTDGLTGKGTVYLGRIPAETTIEIEDYVNKLNSYYNNYQNYSVHNDKELYIGRDVTDARILSSGVLVNSLRDDLITNHIPSHLIVTQLNVSDHLGSSAFDYSSARAALFENALNSGVSLISMLSTSGGPVDLGGFYWNSEETDFNFSNLNKLPFLLGTNCIQGSINDTRWGYRQSVMRQLMVFDNGGIIGAIAPTEGTVQKINGALLNLTHDKIFNENVVNVGELHAILKEEIEQNYSAHEFYANGITLFADPSMPLSVNQHKGGTLSSSEVWEGNIVVDSSIVIPSGVILNIKAGTSIKINNNANFTINGTLNVQGVQGNKVVFDFGAPVYPNGLLYQNGSEGFIDHAIIKNAYFGMRAYYSKISVKNSEVKNCQHGVLYYYANTLSGFAEVLNNHIHDNNQYGIYLMNSSAKIRSNEINDNQRGVYCYVNSSPYLGEAGAYGYNNIHSNNYGIYAYNNSNPFLGRVACTIQGTRNILNNSPYNIYAIQNCTIWAESNYWGQSTPDSTKNYAGTGCSIYYSFPLPSPPVLPSGVSKKINDEEIAFDSKFQSNELKEGKKLDTGVDSYNSEWPSEWKLLYIRNLIQVEKYESAQNICVEILNENSDDQIAFYALDLLWQASRHNGTDKFLQYLQDKVNSKTQNRLSAKMELISASYESSDLKMNRLNKILKKYENRSETNEVIEDVLYQKFIYHLFEENDLTAARNVAAELRSSFPKSEILTEAEILLGDRVSKNNFAKTTSSETETTLPMEYELKGNYPNPFNPSTTISYALPFESNVTVQIFDITGSLVKSIKMLGDQAGYNTIEWNGKNDNNIDVASGAYIYRFSAVSLENNKVFSQSGKMMLVR